MRIFSLIIFVMSFGAVSFSQNRIHPNVSALDNYSIRRIGHKNVGFTVDDKILREVKRHKERYSKYLFEELQDTSKSIVAHLILLKVTGDTMSIGEKGFLDNSTGRSGYDYCLSGLKFKKYLDGKYEVDIKSVADIRNRWIEVLGDQ